VQGRAGAAGVRSTPAAHLRTIGFIPPLLRHTERRHRPGVLASVARLRQARGQLAEADKKGIGRRGRSAVRCANRSRHPQANDAHCRTTVAAMAASTSAKHHSGCMEGPAKERCVPLARRAVSTARPRTVHRPWPGHDSSVTATGCVKTIGRRSTAEGGTRVQEPRRSETNWLHRASKWRTQRRARSGPRAMGRSPKRSPASAGRAGDSTATRLRRPRVCGPPPPPCGSPAQV